jgi:hypothetical protein
MEVGFSHEPPAKFNGRQESSSPTHLDKANVLAVLAEALAADHEVVLADEAGNVAAHAAVWGQGSRCGCTGCFRRQGREVQRLALHCLEAGERLMGAPQTQEARSQTTHQERAPLP